MSKARQLGSKATDGRKNFIINGNTPIFQRGTSFTSGNEYTADRFYISSNRTAVRSTDVPDRATSPYSLAVTGVSGSTPAFYTSVELTRTGEIYPFKPNTKYTISFDIKATASEDIQLRVAYIDTITSATNRNIFVTQQAIDTGTGAWQTVTFTFDTGSDVPNASNVGVEILVLAGAANSTAYLTNVQLEAGEVATDFEQRPIGEEFALCQRYYQQIEERLIIANAANSTTIRSVHPFPVVMRTSPSANLLDTIIAIRNTASGFTSTGSALASFTTEVGVNVSLDGFTGLTGGNMYIGNNGGYYLAVDAEL